jgi:hypothetical protein
MAREQQPHPASPPSEFADEMVDVAAGDLSFHIALQPAVFHGYLHIDPEFLRELKQFFRTVYFPTPAREANMDRFHRQRFFR